MLFGLRQVDNQASILLQNHPPEVLLRQRERSLRRNEGLVVALNAGIDVIGVDVRIRDIRRSLGQTNSRVLERL